MVLFHQEEELTNIFGLLTSQDNISIAELVEIRIDEAGTNVSTMYQFVGGIHDNRGPGLEGILNCINDIFYTAYDSAINQHNCNISKKLSSRFRNIQFKQNI